MEDFTYVIDDAKKPLIAFGSVMQRLQWEYSPYFAASAGTLKSDEGAQTKTNGSILKKFPSKRGFSAFASQTPRMKPLQKQYGPPVGTYHKEPEKSVKSNYKPFNSGVSLRREPSFVTPGPGTYSHHEKLPELKYCLAFGKRRFIWPATAVFCSWTNLAKCLYCGQQPVGDYFHNFNTKLNICRRCMKKQLVILRQCTTKATTRMRKLQELREFKAARYCGFFHNHQTRDTSLTVISRAHLRKKIQLENYLYLYQPVWGKRYEI